MMPTRPDRQERIDAAIAACTECGRRDFPKRSDCDGCTDAVDEEIANELIRGNSESVETRPDPLPFRYNAWVFPTTENRSAGNWLLIHRDPSRSQPGTITIGYGYAGGGQEVTLDAATAIVFANDILKIVGSGEK